MKRKALFAIVTTGLHAFRWPTNPFKSGRTVLRLGGGIFYNRALLRTIDDFTLGARQRFFDTNTLRDPDNRKAIKRRPAPRVHCHESHLSPNTRQRFATRHAVWSAQHRFSRRLDPDLRIPESYQANAGFERDLGFGFVVEANCTVNRGIHLWREFNANAPRLPTGFRSFSDYLASRDLQTFAQDCPDCVRCTTQPAPAS